MRQVKIFWEFLRDFSIFLISMNFEILFSIWGLPQLCHVPESDPQNVGGSLQLKIPIYTLSTWTDHCCSKNFMFLLLATSFARWMHILLKFTQNHEEMNLYGGQPFNIGILNLSKHQNFKNFAQILSTISHYYITIKQ